MAILSGKEILKPYVGKATGYIKTLLSSEHVEMTGGLTLQQAQDELNNNLIFINNSVTVKKYAATALYLQSFYNISDFRCIKVGNLVYINMGFTPKPGTTLQTNSIYSINYAPIPEEIIPNYTAFLHGFACVGNWGEATQMSVLVNSNGFIQYSTPAAKGYYKVSGCWIVD